jgi:chromosome segregation protein
VSARPEDRRAIIEEAAGITKYKRRREAAERKMEATQQNLMRVADIVQELGKQLESLNRQARKAEKYKALRAQIRELELRSAAARYLELTATAAPRRSGTRRSRARRRRSPRGSRSSTARSTATASCSRRARAA